MFRWDLSKFNYPDSNQTEQIRVRFASESEIGAVAEVWYQGLREEEGSPWENYLKKWTPSGAARWFLDSRKRLGAKMLVAEKGEKIVGLNGIISERNSGKGRFFHRNSGLAQLSKARTRVSTPSPDALGPEEGRPSMRGSGNHSRNTRGEISLSEIWWRVHPGPCVG